MLRLLLSQVPNAVTCLNLISGCIAVFFAFGFGAEYGPLSGPEWALIAIGAAAVFDFLDGFTARAMKRFSPLGKDLDSLSDMVSFGVAPAMLILNLMLANDAPMPVPFIAFLIAVCGGVRLAKFNNDTEQSVNFRGLPIPANAIFWVGMYGWVASYGYPGHIGMAVLIVLVSLAMTGNFKMFSLKFKNFDFAQNYYRYVILAAAVLFVVFYGLSGLVWTILLYFLLSCLKRKSL